MAWIYSHWKEDVLSCKSALTLFWFIYFQLLTTILSCFGHMLTTPLQFYLSISFNFFFWVLTFNHSAPQQMKCLRAAIQEINTWHVLKSCQSESFKYSKVLKITETKWQHVNCNFHLKLQYIKFNNFKNEIQKLSKSGCLCYISLLFWSCQMWMVRLCLTLETKLKRWCASSKCWTVVLLFTQLRPKR